VNLRQKLYKKIAFALSLCMLMLWSILGTGTSLAWFTDTSEEIKNIFHFGEFDLVVSHRLPDGTYEEIVQDTKVFDDEALYEPGYVQVVYLKVENKGSVPFDCKMAVSVTDYTLATNVFGQKFNLQDYLEFGVVVAGSEEELNRLVGNRDFAKAEATMFLPEKFNSYSKDMAELGEEGSDTDTKFVAIIVRMPEKVGNEANYRGETVPKVELGVIVSASQQR